MTIYTLHQTCRACGYGPKPSAGAVKTGAGTERLLPVFDLGIQPLANDFANDNDERAGYAPLKVLFCPRCRLAQLSVVVRPDILYSRYLYVTSPSETMRHHFGQLGAALAAEQPFTSLLEIGSNDGTLLRYFAGQGVKVAGIDPAENLAELARKKGIPTVTGVFNHHTADLARAACRSGFDVILARHVFCHVDNWREFISALSMASHRDTLVCIEVPYVKDLLERGEFDTIYHEHLSYLNIGAVEQAKTMTKLQGQLLLAKAKADNTRQSHAQRTAQKQVSWEMEEQRKNQQAQADLARQEITTRQELMHNRLKSLAE